MQAGDSTLNIAITSLNLADWKPFIGDEVSSGIVNGKLQLLSQQAVDKKTNQREQGN